MKGEIAVDVAAPLADVFARAASPAELLGAVGEVRGLERTSGRGGVGTTYAATIVAGKRREPVTAEVVQHDEPSRIAYAIDAGPGSGTVDVRLKAGARPKTTSVRCAWEVEVKGLARFVAGPLLKAWVARHEDELRDRVRAALEGPAPRKRPGR